MPAADRPTWLSSDRLLARTVARPVARFLHIEASGGILLLVGTVAALLWVNSPWKESYATLWSTDLSIDLGGRVIAHDLQHWVNDGLMALFFFVIGLEIKRELVAGQLQHLRQAAVPVAGAIGGMVLPALLYLAVAGGGAPGGGWGIPMATDVAFAIGVLALLGSRVPTELKVLLLALAIVDDIGAILVIAVFYSDNLSLGWALGAGAGLLAVVAASRARVRYLPVYVALGAGVWFMTLESGIHATIAGVALGLLTPAKPFLDPSDADKVADRLSADGDVTAEEVREVSFQLRESVSAADRLQGLLHPWTSYLIIPLFAFANAGVDLSPDALSDAAGSEVAAAVVVGLVVGKALGVTGAIWLAVRLRVGTLPVGVTWTHIAGMAALAGIGFTVSIFVAGLAFENPQLTADAKVGILAASLISAGVGSLVLARARR